LFSRMPKPSNSFCAGAQQDTRLWVSMLAAVYNSAQEGGERETNLDDELVAKRL
jgi:hypothetical protein